MNLSDFISEPVSKNNVLRQSQSVTDRRGNVIRKRIQGLFYHGIFDINEKALSTDEGIPVKCAFKT